MDCCSWIVNLLIGILDSLTPILKESLLLSELSLSLLRLLLLLGLLVDLPHVAPISLGVLDENLVRDFMEKIEQSLVFVLILS